MMLFKVLHYTCSLYPVCLIAQMGGTVLSLLSKFLHVQLHALNEYVTFKMEVVQ